MFSIFKKTILAVFLAVLFQGQVAAEAEEAEEINASSLSELLELVRRGEIANLEAIRQREEVFQRNRANQQSELRRARDLQAREERRSEELEAQYERNENLIATEQERLTARLGSLRELFGVLQQVSGDTSGVFRGSIISAQFPNRTDWLDEFAQSMGKSSKLATIEEIENLWFLLQQEMTQSGKVIKFRAPVLDSSGERVERVVTRIGTFNITSDGSYLKWDLGTQALQELPRQPSARFTNTVSKLESASSGFAAFGTDPTRGQLLGLLIQAPTLRERIEQGRQVGMVIIALGIIGVLLAVERLITLTLVGSRVKSQAKNPGSPKNGNPLGRILMVYSDNSSADTETLQLKLDEAILREAPRINARVSFIRIISMVAPLLGLLGTVVGMILTFQAITLFGTGDPKTMAGGISSALMTTVLGLVVAIPTVLLHSIVQSRASSILHILHEQSAGMLAEQAEKGGST